MKKNFKKIIHLIKTIFERINIIEAAGFNETKRLNFWFHNVNRNKVFVCYVNHEIHLLIPVRGTN